MQIREQKLFLNFVCDISFELLNFEHEMNKNDVEFFSVSFDLKKNNQNKTEYYGTKHKSIGS